MQRQLSYDPVHDRADLPEPGKKDRQDRSGKRSSVRLPCSRGRGIDEKLEADMEEVLDTVVMGRAARNTANIKNRQPIAQMYVKQTMIMECTMEVSFLQKRKVVPCIRP